MSVGIDGLEELKAKLAALPGAVASGAEEAVAEETDAIADDMRDNAPVDSGELVEGIQAEHSGLSGTAASTARHSPFVEYGTSSTPEQPFASPAAAVAADRFPRRMRESVGEEIDGVAG